MYYKKTWIQIKVKKTYVITTTYYSQLIYIKKIIKKNYSNRKLFL